MEPLDLFDLYHINTIWHRMMKNTKIVESFCVCIEFPDFLRSEFFLLASDSKNSDICIDRFFPTVHLYVSQSSLQSHDRETALCYQLAIY